MRIRLATNTDLPAILEISNWAAMNTAANFAVEPESLKSWTQSFQQSNAAYPWLVAESADQSTILGFAKAGPHKGRCAYAWSAEVSVYVHPHHHGNGIGKALYARLIPTLQQQGYVTLIAGITTPNPASERLHESFGFRRTATFHHIGWKFYAWHDVGYWELILNSDPGAPGKIQPVHAVWPAGKAYDASAGD